MKTRKFKVLALILFVVAVALWFFTNKNQDSDLTKLTMGDNTIIQAELADTPEKRVQGLSGREKLGENEGMLFVFDSSSTTSESEVVLDKSDHHGIWMKDMKFAIDIIWLNDDWQIIDIAENITPDTYPQVFRPKEPASYVLEVNADFAAKNKIKIGDAIQR